MGNLYKNESKPTHSANMFAIFSEGVKLFGSKMNQLGVVQIKSFIKILIRNRVHMLKHRSEYVSSRTVLIDEFHSTTASSVHR